MLLLLHNVAYNLIKHKLHVFQYMIVLGKNVIGFEFKAKAICMCMCVVCTLSDKEKRRAKEIRKTTPFTLLANFFLSFFSLFSFHCFSNLV